MSASTTAVHHYPTKTIVPRQIAAQDLENLSGIAHPALRRIFAGRQITSETELDTSLPGLHRPDALLGINAAVDLVVRALERRDHILVVGDFDADGATSSALMVTGLRAAVASLCW